jgi:hypothetical protein
MRNFICSSKIKIINYLEVYNMKNIVKVAGTVVVVGAVGYVVVKKVKERKAKKDIELQQAVEFAEEIINDLNEVKQENK